MTETGTITGKCPTDGTVTTAVIDPTRHTDDAANRLWHNHGQLAGSCGHRVFASPVTGKVGTRECGSWCWDGVGRSCTCQCGGRNHGTAYAHIGATGAA